MNLQDYCKLNGGATLDLDGNIVEFTSGYMCSEFGTEQTFETLDQLLAAISKFKNTNNILFFVGVWCDELTGIWYLDNSKYYNNKNAAINAGYKNKQLAIFDWANKTVINLKD